MSISSNHDLKEVGPGRVQDIVIPKHLEKDPWHPKQLWTNNCFVQWGRHGLVFGGDGSYITAFFEAFPTDGSAGFIRGQGKTLEDAELDAFNQSTRSIACMKSGGHQWSRSMRLKGGGFKNYNNGGCSCVKCDAFNGTAMRPVVLLGRWKDALTTIDLIPLSMGIPPTGVSKKSITRLILKARLAGMNIPRWNAMNKKNRESEFGRACHNAVADYRKKKFQEIP